MSVTGGVPYHHRMGSTVAGRHRLLLAGTLAAALALSACSGGEDAAPTTTLPVTPPSTAAPTTPPPTTAAPTTAAPTTAPPTTAAPTTAPPTTAPAIDPAAAEPVVTQLMIDYIAAVNELGRDPASEERRTALAALASDYALDVFVENADTSVLDREFNRVDPADPSRVEPFPATYSFLPGEPVVGMDGCIIDTDAQVSVGEDGAETIADATPDSFLMTFTFTSTDGRWMVTDLALVEQFEDQIGCE